MPVQLVKVADARDTTTVLYYGDGGSGKTSSLASMANLGRVLYVDAEAGIKRKPLEGLGVDVDNVEMLRIQGLDFPTLEEVFEMVKADLDDDADAWTGVVWDSGTEIYQALLQESVTTRVKRFAARGESNAKSDPFFIDRDDWGRANGEFRQLIRRFRDLPCHFGTAFLPRRDQDDNGKVHVGPSISPGLQADLIGWHDIVCHTTYDDESGLYMGRFKPHGVYQVKDRYSALPNVMVDPTFERIIGYISGELVEDNDPRQDALNGADDDTPSPTPIRAAKPAAKASRG